MAINMSSNCPYGFRERIVQEYTDFLEAAGYGNTPLSGPHEIHQLHGGGRIIITTAKEWW